MTTGAKAKGLSLHVVLTLVSVSTSAKIINDYSKKKTETTFYKN
jgi:hypothetical protein